MTDRADHDWPDEEGGRQAAAGLRGDTGATGDPDAVDMDPAGNVSVGTTEHGGTTTTPRGPEGYGDLGSGTAGSAGSPEAAEIKPGEGSGESGAPA